MTLKIEVTVPHEYIGDGAGEYLANAMAAIGFVRGVSLALPVAAAPTQTAAPLRDKLADTIEAAEDDPAPVVQAEPIRERGKPAPGRARRTKEEIAEDEAADKADATAEPTVETPLISTGEERVDPAEVAAQDAADEKAEVEQHRVALTVDDLKSVMGGYVKKFGMEATQEDGPKIFTEALGAAPAGQPAWKVSLLDGDQERLAKAVDVWTKAVDLNPLKRALAGV